MSNPFERMDTRPAANGGDGDPPGPLTETGLARSDEATARTGGNAPKLGAEGSHTPCILDSHRKH